MSKAIEKLKEEFLAVLPPTLFFFVALHLVSIIRVLMAKGTSVIGRDRVVRMFFGPPPLPTF